MGVGVQTSVLELYTMDGEACGDQPPDCPCCQLDNDHNQEDGKYKRKEGRVLVRLHSSQRGLRGFTFKSFPFIPLITLAYLPCLTSSAICLDLSNGSLASYSSSSSSFSSSSSSSFSSPFSSSLSSFLLLFLGLCFFVFRMYIHTSIEGAFLPSKYKARSGGRDPHLKLSGVNAYISPPYSSVLDISLLNRSRRSLSCGEGGGAEAGESRGFTPPSPLPLPPPPSARKEEEKEAADDADDMEEEESKEEERGWDVVVELLTVFKEGVETTVEEGEEADPG